MSLATATPAGAPAGPASPYRVSALGVLRSEWTKLTTIRSPRWTLLVAVVLLLGLSAIIGAVSAHEYPTMSPSDRATFDAVGASLGGMYFAELAIGVLGVLAITGDYATGMIRSSITAVPRRLPVLWSKIAVTGLVSLVVMTVAAAASFWLGQALLGSHLSVSISAPGAVRSIIGAGVSSALIAILGLAIGAILRNTAAAISTFVGLFFVLPPLASLLPGGVGDHLATYVPSNAASAMLGAPETGAQALSPGAGLAVLAAYAVVLVIAALVQLRRRDV
jgi:ABC-2 type transport system permease protein